MQSIPLLSVLGIVQSPHAHRWLRRKQPAVGDALGGYIIALCLLLPSFGHAQMEADPALTAAIAQIRAFDNHAHPLRVTVEGEEDNNWEALISQEPFPEFPPSVGLRLDNLRNIVAWRDLYGYPHHDLSKDHLAGLLESKQQVLEGRNLRHARGFRGTAQQPGIDSTKGLP